MAREPTYPLAQHPLNGWRGKLSCSLPPDDRTFLTRLMLESSLALCGSFVRGMVLDVECGPRLYEKTFLSGAEKYIGTD